MTHDQQTAYPQRRHDSQHGQGTGDDGWNAAPFVVAVPSLELVAKKVDALVFTDLVQPKSGPEGFFYWLQQGRFQPVRKTSTRQQHCRRALLSPPCDDLAGLRELLVGEPVDLIEDEQRRGRLGRPRATGAGQLLDLELTAARNVDHHTASLRDFAESFGEQLRVGRGIAGDKHQVPVLERRGEAAGKRQVVSLGREIGDSCGGR